MSTSLSAPSTVHRLYVPTYEGPLGHVPFLSPWFGPPKEDPNSLNLGQFDDWAAQKPAHYVLTNRPEEADVYVLPFSWKHTRTDAQARSFAEQQMDAAGKAGRKIVIFFDSDHDEPVAWPASALVFRFSIYSDRRHPGERAVPTFSQDFLQQVHRGKLTPRAKPERPVVGFCGYAPPLGCRFGRQSVREIARYVAYRSGLLKNRRQLIAHAARVQAIRALRRSPQIDSRFILRDQFAFNRWGVLQPGGTAESAARSRREFIENLDTSDYALCARGLANCSIRFYEAISLGRIPVFINTHCVLPYDDLVEWRRICVWVEEKDISRIGSILAEAHRTMSVDEFAQRQVRAREYFENWITPSGFFKNLYRYFG